MDMVLIQGGSQAAREQPRFIDEMKNTDNHRQKKRAVQARKQAADQSAGSVLAVEPTTLGLRHAIDAALHFHTNGKLARAEEVYRKVLEIAPDHSEALHLMGTLALQTGRLELAVRFLREAIKAKPDFPDALNNLGQALEAVGKCHEAIRHYRKAIALQPQSAALHNNLGNALQAAGNPQAALESYRTATALRPDYAEAHFNAGNLLKDRWALGAALECYRNAVAVRPGFTEAEINLAFVLQELGRLSEAVDIYRRVISRRPDDTDNYGLLGLALHMQGKRKEAIETYEIGLLKRRAGNGLDMQDRTFRVTTKSKLAHDIEQFQYLAALGKDVGKFDTLAKIYRQVHSEIDWPESPSASVTLSELHRDRLRGSYNRLVNRIAAPEMQGATLSKSLDTRRIQAAYKTHEFGMTYFDGLLVPEALDSLKRYLLESTIWFDCKYEGGYLGAMLSDGLACPLLLQIADDLCRTFPEIFKDHKLRQLWAYKYDSRLTGIRAHADFAAVNVNFWITPDAANLNPESGGLVVYNAEAPLEWDFKSYNTDQARIRNHIEEQGAGATVVPHRQNRIVIFNSNLFHETDNIEFKSGYENRRINITMLFGHRKHEGIVL